MQGLEIQLAIEDGLLQGLRLVDAAPAEIFVARENVFGSL